jgi:acetylornithine deacetylase
MGYNVARQPVSPGRENLYAYLELPELVFSTHLDCVPPYVALREDETHLHGRGTCDAKGLAAAMVSAAERLASKGERRIGLLFVVGEEKRFRWGTSRRRARTERSVHRERRADREPAEHGAEGIAENGDRVRGKARAFRLPPGRPVGHSARCWTRWTGCGTSSFPATRCWATAL